MRTAIQSSSRNVARSHTSRASTLTVSSRNNTATLKHQALGLLNRATVRWDASPLALSAAARAHGFTSNLRMSKSTVLLPRTMTRSAGRLKGQGPRARLSSSSTSSLRVTHPQRLQRWLSFSA